ncbi:MAG: hypothetical protein U5P41_05220 [Gammaproteobacteria bacterium]|nr:hypothetical protein [Gammaproteobacteria bacterium]
MNIAIADNEQTDRLISGIVEYLSRDPLCLEIRHYPAANELAGSEKLHLLVIMQRELKQSERRERVEAVQELAGQQGLTLDVIFSSPKVWRDLTALIGPFLRIENESTVDWQRP